MIYQTVGDKISELQAVEASLPMNTSHSALRGHLHDALCADMGVTNDWSSDSPYLSSDGVFPSHVVYSHKGQMFRRSYTAVHGAAGTKPAITFGKTSHPVHAAYADSKESAESYLVTDIDLKLTVRETKEIVLSTKNEAEIEVVIESAFAPTAFTKESAGKAVVIPIKVIQPGWGSSAYYSAEVLKRDGAKVFTKGTHMSWNHPTDAQEDAQPEGNLNDLAAVMTEDAHWEDNGAQGPGLYAKAKVFPDYAEQVLTKGPHIGVSIRAGVVTKEGEAEGRKGPIAQKFAFARSVDFVTKAGAGGAVLVPAKESERPHNLDEGSSNMDEKEIKALKESVDALTASVTKTNESVVALVAENAALKQQNLIAGLVSRVSGKLAEHGVSVKESVVRSMVNQPVMKEGKVDDAWVNGVIQDLAESFPGVGGQIVDMGEPKVADLKESAAAAKEDEDGMLASLGVPAAGITAARGGR